MADRKQIEASKIDALYSWLSYDMQKMKAELMNELKYSSVQFGSLYSEMKADKEKSAQAISQEIRYSYKQNQTIYDDLSKTLAGEVSERVKATEALTERLEALNGVVASLEEIQKTVEEIHSVYALTEDVHTSLPRIEDAINEVKYAYMQQQAIYDGLQALISDGVVTKVAEIEDKLAMLEEIDAHVLDCIARIEEADFKSVIEAINEKADENTNRIIDAINAIPVAENVDYTRIVDEVGDKVLDLLSDVVSNTPDDTVDYDKIVYGTAEKVVESLPHAEAIDYARIENSISAAVEKAIAEKFAAIDYDLLSDMVVAKLAKQQAPIDYDRVAQIVDEKLSQEETTYELVLDDEGIDAIADNVAQRLGAMCTEVVEEVVEEEPAVEEAPVVEEVAEEEPAVEEVVEETPVEEAPVEEAPVAEEIAVSSEPNFDELNDQLVDAETGLVIRLKKSFTAKLRQSDEKVKGYYSDIKNELTSYNKINSNVSWHGDRFNYGRDTVAKVNICGKTLCLYLALDPEDPEFKTTVYHQKNVGNQKAYENTPFMVKVKSDAAAKKALRLVGSLAEKLGTEKEAEFVPVDYVEEFAYASTKQLFDEGFIKVTKEKKVDLDF